MKSHYIYLSEIKNIKASMKYIYTAILFCFLILPQSNAQICVGDSGVLLWECYDKIYDDELSELRAAYDYPTHPVVTKNIYKTKSPYNYNNYIGSRIRGFIQLPETETVEFNVTGNQKVEFYLSSNDQVENLQLEANTPDYTNTEEHDKYPEQTSQLITLQGGQFYYFELLQVETTGSDFVYLYWKNPQVNADTYTIITEDYIWGVGCTDECPSAGTACDDGDATTSDDMEDGFCHCIGSKETTNTCIGDRAKVQVYRYDTIPGGDLNDLYEAATFPGTPDYSELLDFVGIPSQNNMNESGAMLQGYLTVPVTGNYKFNVTGDDETILFISSDDDPANKQAHQCFVSSWTYMTEHDKFIWQSTGNIYMEKNKYYYLEINEKEGSGSEHYSAFWQTPFTEEGQWKRIPTTYFYDYECEIACIEEGTTCDDGDPFTNNDQYDDNCECHGTPCTGPDCDSPLANYVPYAKCDITDNIDNNEENNWLSCTTITNPNTIYGDSHWIMYDMGQRHELYQTYFWNYNVAGETDKGFQSVAIDYSVDGISWSNYGNYTWPLATGEGAYAGFAGPDLMGTYAQYILITSLDAGECRGLGKSSFTAVLCPLAETECDDLDKYTVNDKYNDNCECIGTPIEINDCIEEIVALGDSTLYDSQHSASQDVSSISQIAENNVVGFVGGKSVVLEPGFETGPEAIFIATIDPCEEAKAAAIIEIRTRAQKLAERQEQRKQDELAGLQVIADENSDYQTIRFFLPTAGKTKLEILQSEKVLYTLIDHKYSNTGVYDKVIRTKRMASGVYQVRLTSDNGVEVERLVVE